MESAGYIKEAGQPAHNNRVTQAQSGQRNTVNVGRNARFENRLL
jgi:hypothetical protein